VEDDETVNMRRCEDERDLWFAHRHGSKAMTVWASALMLIFHKRSIAETCLDALCTSECHGDQKKITLLGWQCFFRGFEVGRGFIHKVPHPHRAKH
jgi:hypothetical protein